MFGAMKVVPRLLLTAVLLSACRSSPAGASPCSGIDRSLKSDRKAALASALAKELRVSTVDILESFRGLGWSIIYVDTHESDYQFLFFSGDPLSSHSVTGWGGAAMENEEQEIKDWTIKNAPGIPDHLAACFAWHVTKDR
jgi:hypothetical protein